MKVFLRQRLNLSQLERLQRRMNGASPDYFRENGHPIALSILFIRDGHLQELKTELRTMKIGIEKTHQ